MARCRIVLLLVEGKELAITIQPVVFSIKGLEGAYKVLTIKPGNPKTADVQNVKTGEVVTDVEASSLSINAVDIEA